MVYAVGRLVFVFWVLIAVASGCGQAAEPLVGAKITISKETTYVLGPVRPDGYIDYAAAINDVCGRGVTPENNAAVPIWQAIGPAELPQGVRDRFLKLLGIPNLPDKGDYLVEFQEYLQRVKGDASLDRERLDEEQWEERCYEQYDKAEKAPWSQEQYPLIAGWLKANEKPLKAIVEGVRQPRLYSPVVADDDDSLMSVLLPQLSGCREAARLLTIRAMLQLQSGDVRRAWNDLLACHRLARLIGQGPYLIDFVVAGGVESIAYKGDAALAHYGRLSVDQARECQADLLALPPLPKAVEKVILGERLFSLASLSRMARRGVDDVDEEVLSILGEKDDHALLKKLAADPRVDWDAIMREANEVMDRTIEAHRQPTRRQRQQSLAKLASALEAAVRQAREAQALSEAPTDDASSQAITTRLSAILFDDSLCAEASANVEDVTATRMTLSRLAFALAGYLSDYACYPESLAELSPKYIAEVPKDVFADAEFRYQRRGRGYLLYSVGVNGKDEGGHSCWERPWFARDDDAESEADDIAIRTPTEGK